MPRREPTVATACARLRRLQARLPDLSVPALLQVRDAIEPLLDAERLRSGDVDAVLRAADRD